LAALFTACGPSGAGGGGAEPGPASAAEAFEQAGVAQPPEAAEVRYAGVEGDAPVVWLQFVVPDPRDLRALLPGCALMPVQGQRPDPLGDPRPSTPTWWVQDAPSGARGCRVAPGTPDGLHRAVRVDPV